MYMNINTPVMWLYTVPPQIGIPQDDWSNTRSDDCHPIGQSPGGGKEASKARWLFWEGNEQLDVISKILF